MGRLPTQTNQPDSSTRKPAAEVPPTLGPLRKSVYALGDFTLNTALSSMSLIYASFFLTQVAGLRPALAGLVPLRYPMEREARPASA